MNEELAESLDKDTDKLLSRWEGRPDYVLEDIFRVRDLDTKEVSNLTLTNYQRQFVHAYFYGDESTVNVLKGRRTGYSFIGCACVLLDAILTSHGFFAITAPSKSQAKDRIEDIYDLMEWSRLNFNPKIDNRDEIELSNNTTIMAFSGNPDTSRGGDSADTLFIDEMDFLADQEESMRGFSPFVALGDATTVQLSTPRLENSLFMEDHDRGSETGENGIISIYQPAFENPKQIDEKVSLLEQDVEPVMPYLNIEAAEKDRARDPNGFRQEYLCEPVQDEYRFFDKDTVAAAIERGRADDYQYGPATGAVKGGKVVMGVDIAGGGKDDTAVVIVEHADGKRHLRYHEAVTDNSLSQVGIEPAIARNPSAVAERINQLYRASDVDKVITDATNIGEGFDSEIRQVIGRGVNSFNFSDRDAVADMMGDLNYAFHNSQVSLHPDDKLRDQILAIVKDKRNKGSSARFSGKDHAPEGKDDLAIAFALAAFPPNMNTDNPSPQQKERTDVDADTTFELPTNVKSGNDSKESGYRGATHRKGRTKQRNNDRRYSSRYERT